MTDGRADLKADPADREDLMLRGRPRPVTRFNRKVLIGAAAVVCVVLFAATLIALEPFRLQPRGQGEELINTERKSRAEGLDTMPRTYADVKPPDLGPPLQGDIGPPVVKLENELGVGERGLRPNAEADAQRAERLRFARQAQQAREASVFFQLSAKLAETQPVPSSAQATAAALQSPAATTGETLVLDRARDPSAQGRKIEFLQTRAETDVINRHALQTPLSADSVLAGTVIAASLITGINSDLPGFVIAQVTEQVFDTVTGRRLLIPQGTKLIGKYDSVISFGQRRALVVWNRLILPDGSSIVIENLPATDARGYAGLEDEVDFHTWQLVKGAALSTLLSVGAEVGAADAADNDTLSATREAVQQNATRVGQDITDRNLNVQPTITIRPGWPLRILVRKDLVLREYKP